MIKLIGHQCVRKAFRSSCCVTSQPHYHVEENSKERTRDNIDFSQGFTLIHNKANHPSQFLLPFIGEILAGNRSRCLEEGNR